MNFDSCESDILLNSKFCKAVFIKCYCLIVLKAIDPVDILFVALFSDESEILLPMELLLPYKHQAITQSFSL